ncbi:Transposase OS=Methylobacterium nodulans (strain ORS2060 / LMG 21967) GN=Mnod_2584 PE=4 SV=1 [Tuwongella immobilis]|uniref:Transposase n=1 Tax=Tuwongella immobilis TaxID=692036 RepID=A0A6C2YWP5_9BACT|nr:Transposase OS=Methylobacterium nodulans (strain ORS2060 / LMG 21967) GN=Mnod_2584 PE=4 SV=1 [Tuwongella immobilis]VTS08034.1 Transposase OS=Methylobacterium nodulans (strain ORS2060 / LMG 21967) GN=Mnod_2584 PE=4 SV=1 [Tuwongella immobilis]
MPKTAKQLTPTITHHWMLQLSTCPNCRRHFRADYTNRRPLTTLDGVTRLNLTIRRCHLPVCPRFHKHYRPEAEGLFALPRHEFGFDVIARIGRLRYREHPSIPEMLPTYSNAWFAAANVLCSTCTIAITNYYPPLSPKTADSKRCWPTRTKSSSPLTAFNLISGMKCCGACATACPVKTSRLRACPKSPVCGTI